MVEFKMAIFFFRKRGQTGSINSRLRPYGARETGGSPV